MTPEEEKAHLDELNALSERASYHWQQYAKSGLEESDQALDRCLDACRDIDALAGFRDFGAYITTTPFVFIRVAGEGKYEYSEGPEHGFIIYGIPFPSKTIEVALKKHAALVAKRLTER